MATIKIGHLPKLKSQLITPLILKMLIMAETNTRAMAIERIICGFNFQNLLIEQVASIKWGMQMNPMFARSNCQHFTRNELYFC